MKQEKQLIYFNILNFLIKSIFSKNQKYFYKNIQLPKIKMSSDPYNIDIKIIQSFKPEDYTTYEKIFKNVDKEKNGTINQKGITEILNSLGYRDIPEEDSKELFDEIDSDKDGLVTYEEYLNMMKKISASEEGEQNNITRILTKSGKGILRITGANDMTYQSFSEEERAAFTKVFNVALFDDNICKKYLPMDPDSNDIFSRLKDGVLLCKLINKIQPGTIDERVIITKENMNVFQMVGNLNLAISASKSIGCQVINIFPETIMEGKQVMILGILWQVVKRVVLGDINLKNYPQLVRLLKENEQLSDLLKLSPEEILLRWFNYHLEKAGYDKPIKNFSSDIKDSEKYILLLNQLDKNQCDTNALNEPDLKKRALNVLSNAKKIGAETYITANDIISGNPKLNTLFTAAIFNANCGLDPPTEQEKYDAAKLLDDDIEGGREERAFRMWINSLGLPDVYVNNLYEECKTGLLMLQIIDKIKPGIVNWKIVDKKVKNKFSATVNCQEVIDSAIKSKYTIVGIGAQDIREGNKKYILAIVWQLMRAHTLQIIGNKSEEELVNWGNSLVSEEMKIKNLKDKSVSNSLWFIYIMKTIEPRAINWDIIIQDKTDDESKENNAKYCISIARKLGATVFCVWEDIVEVKSRLLLTFLASVYDVAQSYKPV